jgi:hypothetical protein
MSFIDGAVDCLEQFVLILIKQQNKMKKIIVKKRNLQSQIFCGSDATN